MVKGGLHAQGSIERDKLGKELSNKLIIIIMRIFNRLGWVFRAIHEDSGKGRKYQKRNYSKREEHTSFDLAYEIPSKLLRKFFFYILKGHVPFFRKRDIIEEEDIVVLYNNN